MPARKKPTTNITPDHKATFEALLGGDDTFCLFSCFLDGQPTAAICRAGFDETTREYVIQPLFVAVTPAMKLTDHEGRAP